MKSGEIDKIAIEAAELARTWQERANALLSKDEKKIQKQMARLLTHPMDKVVLTKLIDQSFRAEDTGRVADQINEVLGKYGLPQFLSLPEKALGKLFLAVGRYISGFSVPKMINQIREEAARAIIPGEEDRLFAHLRKRKEEGVRMNINHLGEAVLGEDEALHRLDTYIRDMGKPEIEYMSVKISTIYSQIQALSFEPTVEVLIARLTLLFRAARDNQFIRKDGSSNCKFINLDMEEYRDLEITAEAFMRTLDKEEFKGHQAGIVLQAYMPDAWPWQHTITEWAKKRVAAGGAPIKIRIVKGANMEMEQVEASLFNWPLAPYDNKLDVDANYKRMVLYGMEAGNIEAVHLGIASHNLFELAFAFCVAKKNDALQCFSFELLEGMADHVRRAIQETSGEVLLYAPVAGRDQFINAIAYLIRRLDENTAEENFLRYSCDLSTDSEQWKFLRRQYLASVQHMDKAGETPHRIQDRASETFPEKMGTFYEGEFLNEADTDWCLPANRAWAEGIRDTWMKKPGDTPIQIPVVIAGEEILEDRKTKECFDPNQGKENTLVSLFRLGTAEDAEKAIDTAVADPDGWRKKSYEERNEVLSKVAMELRKGRADLIGAAAAGTGKVFGEADVEISEAIDFAEYYPFSAKAFDDMENLQVKAKGVGLVISPWNFPIAIPCGGMLSMLAAGNTVIFKPASDAVLAAWELCKCIWRAGVSKNTLQFIPCSGASVGPVLTTHPDVDAVILTGGTDTGLDILKAKPEVALAAETGGKNATIVTAMADRDQAIKNIVYSAFPNAGQKCSATSLVVLEEEVYNDPLFKKQLADAARSFSVGSAWEFKNKMATLIKPPSGDLLRALTQLEPGESWVLKPKEVDGNPYIWSPGIKWGVAPGGYTHMTEFFGPVVGVVCAKNLEHAVAIVNQTGYGLTSGIESLDIREIDYWKANIKAGNLYVNRGTTGAIVLRQPFGGMRKSAIGAGIKAGGPNYVSQFMDIEETMPPKAGAVQEEHFLLRVIQEWKQKISWGELAEYKGDLEKSIRAIKSYLWNYEQEFGLEKDYFHLRGQDNIVRYLPMEDILVRVSEKDSLFEVLARCAAVTVARARLILSIPDTLENEVTAFLASKECKLFLRDAVALFEDDAAVAAKIGQVEGMRYASGDRVPAEVFAAAARTGYYIARNPVMMEGRVELLQYFHEQAVCDNYHRYGNLGERGLI